MELNMVMAFAVPGMDFSSRFAGIPHHPGRLL